MDFLKEVDKDPYGYSGTVERNKSIQLFSVYSVFVSGDLWCRETVNGSSDFLSAFYCDSRSWRGCDGSSTMETTLHSDLLSLSDSKRLQVVLFPLTFLPSAGHQTPQPSTWPPHNPQKGFREKTNHRSQTYVTNMFTFITQRQKLNLRTHVSWKMTCAKTVCDASSKLPTRHETFILK